MQVSIKKEIELIGVASVLRGDRFDYLVSPEACEYVKQIKEKFGKFRQHQFFKMYTSNIKASDLASEFDCHYDNHLENVLNSLWQFGKDIHFDQFFEENKEYYDQCVSAFEKYLKESEVEAKVLEFYHLDIFPFAPEITLVSYIEGAFVSGYSAKSRARHIYIGNKIEEGIATFLSQKNLCSIFHELSHLIFGKRIKDILKDHKLFREEQNTLFSFLERQEHFDKKEISYYYPNKAKVVEEYCIRAVTMLYEQELGMDMQKSMDRIEWAGFLHFDIFYESVKKYCSGEITIEEMIDHLIDRLQKYAKVELEV